MGKNGDRHLRRQSPMLQISPEVKLFTEANCDLNRVCVN